MIKKILSVILTILMLVLPLSVVSFAEEAVTLKLTSEKVYAGDEFILNLFISDNSKVSGAVIDIFYDKTKLQYISSENGAILNENANISIRNIDGENPHIRFTYLDPSSELTSSGVIAKLKFKSLDNAVGKTELKISVPSAGDFVTKDLDRIPYEVVNGVVDIINTAVSDTKASETVTETLTETTTQTVTETVSEPSEEEPEESNVWFVVTVVSVSLLVIVGAVFAVVMSKRRANK